MYRIILGLIIITSIATFVWLQRSDRLVIKVIWHKAKQLFGNLSVRGDIHISRFFVLRRIFYVLTSTLFFALALSGFLPILILGGHLSGVMLIIHVTIAPFFAVSLMISLLLWAHFQQFDNEDFSNFKKYFAKKESVRKYPNIRISCNRVLFWLFAVIALPAILSMVISMYPFIGTEGQNFLLNTHRYSVLFLFIIYMVHFFIYFSDQEVAKNK